MSDDLRRVDDVQIKVLEERVNMWMESTTEYRKSLCSKLDIVLEKINALNTRLDKLPCESRKPQWEWVTKNIYALWTTIGLIFTTLLVEWLKRK